MDEGERVVGGKRNRCRVHGRRNSCEHKPTSLLSTGVTIPPTGLPGGGCGDLDSGGIILTDSLLTSWRLDL